MSTRYVVPFLFPVWLIAYPVICHVREFGRIIPTDEVRTFVYSSSGPWSHDVCIVFIFSLVIAFCIHAALLLITVLKRRWRDAAAWFAGALAGVAATSLAIYWFGNLMDI